MKRLLVNAFCPGEHKVISSHAATADLPPTANGTHVLCHWPILVPIRNIRMKQVLRACGIVGHCIL
jgi:hypothetical protein